MCKQKQDLDKPDPATSARMALIRSRNTKPELQVRKMLTGLGVHYRLHRSDIPGRPDLYIARTKTAVFVHGCFWHQHACRAGDRRPHRNRIYWLPKLQSNVERDKRNRARLLEEGINPVYLWTCQVKSFEKMCKHIAKAYHSAAPRNSSR